AAALSEDREVMRDVLVAEAGCPVMLTDVVQLDQPLKDFSHWADVAVSYEYETGLPETELWGGRHRREVWREPVGVGAAITALIALDDADVANTALGAGFGMCTHAGQGCAMTTRLLVPKSRYDEAVEGAVAGMAAVKVGDPTDPETFQGPQISARQRERVLG